MGKIFDVCDSEFDGARTLRDMHTEGATGRRGNDGYPFSGGALVVHGALIFGGWISRVQGHGGETVEC